ncbi:hypothetical protein CDL12_17179 [Handroanthus impetiginosus]|uniref:Uncharacterized protein n=1 Tax=Handroanthus impetiginosus TaxID=429701 RepID=A0A2G9GY74_9LAMI|nr:hypothetical protein CDL12_17179 [Handroanthus impetiginosus]
MAQLRRLERAAAFLTRSRPVHKPLLNSDFWQEQGTIAAITTRSFLWTGTGCDPNEYTSETQKHLQIDRDRNRVPYLASLSKMLNLGNKRIFSPKLL